MNLRKAINATIGPTGYELVRRRANDDFPSDFTESDKAICAAVRPFTMARHIDRIYSVINAVRYVSDNHVEGAIVECGVWRGGMMMAAALTLGNLGKDDRQLFLYDTFEGMVQPSELDRDIHGNLAKDHYQRSSKEGNVVDWCLASLDEVRGNMASTGYPKANIHYLKGRVEETIPDGAPDKIALLRLDTDWYESSLHELVHLYPRMPRGAVLILDDYGFWQGARKATDEYFAREGVRMHLIRVDSSCRVGVKID